MWPVPRPEVAALSGCEHGGLDYAELQWLGIDAGEVLDFSVNSNPFGPPPGIKEALSQVAIERYPDSSATGVRSALAGRLRVPPENIIVGNGSVELLRLAAMAYIRPADSALVVQPTFGEYELACRIMGSRIVSLPLSEETGFRLDVAEMAKAVETHHPRLIFLCNPNNPTGEYLEKPQVETIVQASPGSLLILDEAYLSFVDAPWPSVQLLSKNRNLVILRSMTKDYALAGLRLGYAVSSAEIIGCLEKVRPPWNVNAVAQKAALFAVANERYLDTCRGELARAKQFLTAELTRLGLTVLPSRANFLLVKVGAGKLLRSGLLKRKILVRDCASFGLPQHVRIAVRTLAECQRLINALEEVIP